MLSEQGKSVPLTPRILARILVATLLIVFFLHSLTLFVSHVLGFPVAKGFVPFFHMDYEGNFPTFVSFLILLSCSLTCAVWASVENRGRHQRVWALISFAFLFLATDEAFEIHEQFSHYLTANAPDVGLPYFAWLVPYAIAVLALGLYLLRWFLELDRPFQLLLAASGIIFLSGALGLELIASQHYASLPPDREVFRTLTGDLLATAEEACEFIGASLFLWAMVWRLGGFSFRILHPDLG